MVTHMNGDIIGSNHFWFRKVDFESADLVALAEAFRHFFYANNGIKDYIVDDIHWSMRLVDERAYDGEVYLRDEGDDGEDITELYSLNDALVLTMYTGHRGRAYRGRLYFFGWAEDALTEGVFNAAAQNAFYISLDAMQVAAALAGWTWGVRTSQIDKVPQIPRFITAITSTAIRSGIPGTQMRRAARP